MTVTLRPLALFLLYTVENEHCAAWSCRHSNRKRLLVCIMDHSHCSEWRYSIKAAV